MVERLRCAAEDIISDYETARYEAAAARDQFATARSHLASCHKEMARLEAALAKSRAECRELRKHVVSDDGKAGRLEEWLTACPTI
jgi:septal ring factor EnvC (AmiA/AmiB activator)